MSSESHESTSNQLKITAIQKRLLPLSSLGLFLSTLRQALFRIITMTMNLNFQLLSPLYTLESDELLCLPAQIPFSFFTFFPIPLFIQVFGTRLCSSGISELKKYLMRWFLDVEWFK